MEFNSGWRRSDPGLTNQASYARDLASIFMVVALAVYGNQSIGQTSSQTSNLVGEAIFRRGVLPSGELLSGIRSEGNRVEGVDASCMNCHRRSGLGAKEGQIAVPPITGRYLFHPHSETSEDPDLPYVETMRSEREPYTDATLARAIRYGIDSQGRTLDYLMPRFDLTDANMADLTSYLKGLNRRKAPGVTDTVLHFATIITPDADPTKRKAMLDVLDHYFADKNALQMGPGPALHSSRKMMFMVHRRWQLHVWELNGPESTWEEQLKRRFAAEPVLAVLSGLGRTVWDPVQGFCEHQAIPCLFPNVEVPPVRDEHTFYSLYFSKGLLLEADLIKNQILDPGNDKVVRTVQQIYRKGDSGESVAELLTAELRSKGIAVINFALPMDKPGKEVAASVRAAPKTEAIVLWLRPSDIAALEDEPYGSSTVFMSGLMGGLEKMPLPAGWRERTHIAYPFDLPERRRVRVDYALGWFALRKIPIVAEQVQADTYLACGLLAETLSHMADAFVPDYLVERIDDSIEHRIITGYYPRLALAPGQRFASKGGYVVRFAEPLGTRLIALHDWMVPN